MEGSTKVGLVKMNRAIEQEDLCAPIPETTNFSPCEKDSLPPSPYQNDPAPEPLLHCVDSELYALDQATGYPHIYSQLMDHDEPFQLRPSPTKYDDLNFNSTGKFGLTNSLPLYGVNSKAHLDDSQREQVEERPAFNHETNNDEPVRAITPISEGEQSPEGRGDQAI